MRKPAGWLLLADAPNPDRLESLHRQSAAAMLANAANRQTAASAASIEGTTAIELASMYLIEQSPPDEPIIPALFDRGDKVFIIGQPKQRKSFLALQLAICLACDKQFLDWKPSGRQRVLMLQYELKTANYRRRVRYVAGALGVSADDLGNWLSVLNLRGKQYAFDQLRPSDYDAIFFDPFYKVLAREKADEVSAADVSRVLDGLDKIAECGPAVVLIHHGTKGRIGDKQITDRGSGSGVLSRDFDGCITMSPHQDHPAEWTVLETILRNHPSPAAKTVEFRNGLFIVRNDVLPVVETSLTAKAPNSQGRRWKT